MGLKQAIKRPLGLQKLVLPAGRPPEPGIGAVKSGCKKVTALCGLLPSPQWGAAKFPKGRAIAVDPENRVGGIDRDKGKELWLPNRRYSCRSNGPCGRLSRSSQGTCNPLCCASSFLSGTIGHVHPAGAVVAADMSERSKLPRAPVRRPGLDRSYVFSAIPGT